jgi:hypothetical protein
VNLTKRGKWLTGIAALIVVYVAFGPKEPEPVEARRSPAAATSVRSAQAAGAAVSSVPVAHTLLALAHRVVDQTSAGALFAAHSWYVAPPPPPPAPVVDTAPAPPPKPTAPPLPYQYIGSYTPDGQAPVFFLSKGDRVFDVHVGDTLEGTYSVDSFDKSQIQLTYKPLNIQQQLIVGSTQ